MELAWMIEDAGHSIVGPEASVEATQRVLARHRVDLALLDVLLGNEMVFPVSKLLDSLGTPFIFVTGYAPPPCRPNIGRAP